MQKIVLVNHDLGQGGVSKFIYDVALEYKKRGLRISVISLTSMSDIYGKELQKEGVDVIYLSDKDEKYSIKNLFRLIKKLKPFDIVHANTYPAQAWTACVSIFLNKKHYILTEHATTNNRRRKKWFRYIDSWMYSRFNKVVSVSNETNRNLKKWIIPSKEQAHKFFVINNGINLERYYQVIPLRRESLNFSVSDQDVLICMAARFSPPKDQLTLIRSMTELDEKYKLLLLGHGDTAKEVNLVNQLKLSHRVFFMGYRLDADKIIKSCDIAVLSTDFEGFGLVVVESMAMGIPTICSDVDELSNLVGNESLLFEKGNATDLALKIKNLVENKEKYLKIVQGCIIKSQKYSLTKMVDEYLKVYDMVLP
ncbi:glycosyltransferase family 4 protein [Francisella philomiragia]|uniref:Glycosyl transferases group 1 family protein n=1 Tax=Francisella philomiragia TaxID=28110 RepID=A0A0B6D6X0_9GAMM|nr:glycosyltransferase family 4 protein [Francisella philomiragia]AJI53388.1 glycosyl transferases group 1 family protein [Francisella philomiragia]